MRSRDARRVTRDATEVALGANALRSKHICVCHEPDAAVLAKLRSLFFSDTSRVTRHASRCLSLPAPRHASRPFPRSVS
jgi:hypothetical protein